MPRPARAIPLVLVLGFGVSLSQLHAQPRLATEGNEVPAVPFEFDSLATPTYPEVVAFYERLHRAYPDLTELRAIGRADNGEQLYAFAIGTAGARARLRGRDPLIPNPATLLVNNAIHAGEPCGVDASMLYARDLLAAPPPAITGGDALIAIVPAYNLGGLARRGAHSRANQVGPREHGFRGNARNLDLNRDFAKRVSANARALTRLIGLLSPDVFVDTHTTNGADYAYHLTVIGTQPEKLGPVLGPYLRETVLPRLYAELGAAGHPVSPYVYSPGVPQEAGMYAFVESPRYSSGYAALHHSLAFITEAHMLKPFAVRVRATEAFLQAVTGLWLERADDIADLRARNAAALASADSVALAWEVDMARADTLAFRGYRALREPSAVTGGERLRYDRAQPVTVPTAYRSYARPSVRVRRPRAYYLPHYLSEWLTDRAVDGLPTVAREPLREATTVRGTMFHIDDFATVERPYEGAYLHDDVEVSRADTTVRLPAGWVRVPVTPGNLRLLTALLEPEAPDGLFAWGELDSWLQQKEHFSAYVFEDTAAHMLAEDAALRGDFEARRATDRAFRDDPAAQLEWLYRRSVHYERPGWLPLLVEY